MLIMWNQHIASIPTVYSLLVSTNSSAFGSLPLGDGDLPVHPSSVWSLMVAVQYETLQDLSVYSLLTIQRTQYTAYSLNNNCSTTIMS